MADVFFCYDHKDIQAAEHWSQRLTAAGISVWMDPRGGKGTVWTQEIVQAIEECSVMIVLLSRGSIHSHNVVKEVSLASERGKSIVPVKLEAVEIPSTMQYQLGHLTAVELYESLDVPKLEQAKADALLAALAKSGLVTALKAEEPSQTKSPTETFIEETVEAEEVEEAERQAEVPTPTKSKKSWAQIRADMILKARMLKLAVRFQARRVWKGYRALNQKVQIAIGAVLGVVLLAIIFWIGWPESAKKGTGYKAQALPADQLDLAVQHITLKWQKGGFGVIEGEKQAYGVAGVYREKSGKLYMVTQASVVGLAEMVQTEKVPPLKIKTFELFSTAASNFMREAGRFAYKPGGLNLAVLETNVEGYKEGKDYILLPYRSGSNLDEEDEVMLLHWFPSEVNNRHTPEQITGRRKITVDGREIWVYQVGSGHKTGLIVKKDGEGYFWVGVIAYHDGGASYAISPADFLKLDLKFYYANRDGAAEAIREILDFDAIGKD